ncbi:MAG: TatD family hydrolase [Flavobacteriales bacterium]|nr:TatD family hydrolase [Flavobacteriales bacterium]
MEKKGFLYVDTHSHLYDEVFDNDILDVINRAVDSGVGKIILPAVDSSTIDRMLALGEQYPHVFEMMIGLHPTSITSENVERELEVVREHLDRGAWIGIGEIGLDFYWDTTYKKEQEEAFERQLSWAVEREMPVSIHSREAMDRTLEILSSYKVKGVMHCFSGTFSQACKVIDMGLKIGVGGTVTYKTNLMREIIRTVGYEHIVYETDAPYLPPVPYRGKRNESSYIPHIVAYLSEYLGVSIAELASAAQKNVESVFGIVL